MMRSLPLVAAALVAGATASPSASLTADVQFVYNFETQHCPNLPEPWCNLSIDIGCDADVPDAPVVGFQIDGNITLLASVDLGSRGLYGTSLDTVEHSCTLYANSTDNMDIR